MYKRGDVRTKVIVIAIAAFVLAMLFFGGIPFLIEQTKKLRDFTSSGNGDYASASAKGAEYIRYNILNGEVQWHDSINWRNFEGGQAVINGKKVFDKNNNIQGMTSLEEDFRDFYFEKREPIVFGKFKIARVQEVTTYISGTNNIQFESGDVIIEYNTFTNSGSPVTLYFMLPWNDGELKFKDFRHPIFQQTNPIENNQDLINWIRKNAMAFRDGVLKKSIRIYYYDIKNNPSDIINICVKKHDNKYLVADLSKPVAATCNCETLENCEVKK